MRYYRKVPYVRCGECGFRKENTHDAGPHIGAGDYCPRCAAQFTEYNELHRQSFALAGGRPSPEPEPWSPPSKAEVVVQAVSIGVPLFAIYALFRFFAAGAKSDLTINGEPIELFGPVMFDAMFAVIVMASLFAFAMAIDVPGYVKYRVNAGGHQ